MNQKEHPIMAELDLEPIIIKAMDAEEGNGWSFDFALRVADEYRKFLILCRQNPAVAVVPSCYVDDFWHLHILDTAKYQSDCAIFLGEFLHHFPYFGMRGERDAENLRLAWQGTLGLYLRTFGAEAPADLWPKSNRCPNCGRRSTHGEPNVFDEHRPHFADVGLAV